MIIVLSHTPQHNIIQYNTIQHNTIQHNTPQHKITNTTKHLKMSSSVIKSGFVTGLTFMSCEEGIVRFYDNKGFPFDIAYDINTYNDESLEWVMNGSFDDSVRGMVFDTESTWNMEWRYDRYEPSEDDFGGTITIMFKSSNGGDVMFEWSNSHDGNNTHAVTIGNKIYMA